MATIKDLILATMCIGNTQRPCDGCVFNPVPGIRWSYGCVKGETDMAAAIREALANVPEDPRVLTLEEADDVGNCFVEIPGGGAVFRRINVHWDMNTVEIQRFAGESEYVDADDYGITFRAWNRMPTREQMAETEWPDE